MSSAPVALPSFLERRLIKLPASCHDKIAALHKQFGFTDDSIEAFEANTGSLTAVNISDFKDFLDRERTDKAAAEQASRRAGVAAGPAARRGAKRGGGAALRGALATVVPASAPAAVASEPVVHSPEKAQTPAPKRARQGHELEADLATTPKPVQKAKEVVVKSSLNDAIAVKDYGAAAPVKVDVLGDAALWTGPRHGAYAWMDEPLEQRAADRDRRLAEAEPGLLQAMRAKHPERQDLVVGVVGVPSQAEVVLCGRILCEGLEGRLNERAMLLEGSKASSRGARVQLNVSGCAQVAAFPGQMVAVLGRSGTTGTTFHAVDIVAGYGVPRAPALVPPAGASVLRALLLAGPFCTWQGLDYAPLQEALDYAMVTRPEVVLIMGPFVDANNRMVSSGEVSLPGGRNSEAMGFEGVYSTHVLPMLRKGIQNLKRVSPNSEVLLVPSLEDVLNFHPMPQPPFDVSVGRGVDDSCMKLLEKAGARFLPNPAHISLNGLKVSVTSADALSPVLRSGLVLRPEDKKIEQALRLLVEQRSLFPVLPRDPPQIDEARASALNFPEDAAPDIVIFPSVSGTPAGHLVDGRLFINPGTVCRAAAMGTFAELYVEPSAAGGLLSSHARVDIKSFAARR